MRIMVAGPCTPAGADDPMHATRLAETNRAAEDVPPCR